MAAWVREEEKASETRQRKREAEEADKGGVALGVTLDKLSLAGAIFRAARVCICAMHSFYFMISLHVFASYLSLLLNLLVSYNFVLFAFFCRFFALFFRLSLELCSRYSSDIFLSSRPRAGLATAYITGYD